MSVSFELQLADWRSSERFWKSRQKLSRSQTFTLWLMRATVCLFLLPTVVAPLRYFDSSTFQSAWKSSGFSALWPLGIVLIPLGTFALVWFGAPLLQGRAFRESGYYGKQLTLTLERDGVRGDNLIPWSLIESVEESPSHIFLLLEQNSVLIIPKRAFESDFAATQFAAQCRDGLHNAKRL